MHGFGEDGVTRLEVFSWTTSSISEMLKGETKIVHFSMLLLWEQTLKLCLHVIEINGEIHVRDLNFASTSCSQIHNDSKINIISIQSKEILK